MASEVSRSLTAYAQILTPWAEAVAGQMLAQVAQSNWNQWNQWMEHSKDISRALRQEIEHAPTGITLRTLQAEQVSLIKSLPLKAAERVQDLALGNLYSGERADTLAKHLLETTKITENRAKLIARTETSRVSANLTKARAEYAGSVGFIWRTSRDGDVRKTHKEQEGKFFTWDNPPKTDEGLDPYIPGCGPNCFPGDTPLHLSNGIRHMWRVAYEGKVVDINAGGSRFTATLNHPILTTRGWVAAGALNCGDDIIAMGEQMLKVVEKDEHYNPPTFDEVFRAFGESRVRVDRPFALDFHGDIFAGDVDDVFAADHLPLGTEASLLQQLCDLVLTCTQRGITRAEILHVLDTHASGISEPFFVLLRALVLGNQNVSLSLTAEDNAQALQIEHDPHARHADLLGDSGGTQPRLVESDQLRLIAVLGELAALGARKISPDLHALSAELLAEHISSATNSGGSVNEGVAVEHQRLRVLDKVERDYSGHVYTIESENGWFGVTAAGIVSKNCRCWPQPVWPDDDD